MLLEPERWLELRRFRALHEAGASISEIARETGLNWRTVKKYLESDGPPKPPAAAPRSDLGNQVIKPWAHVIDAWLRAEVLLKAAVIHERLVEQYDFPHHYQRVKMYVQQARPRIAEELGYTPRELARLHRRFEVVPGAQAQVDWGDEGGILAHVGIPKVYSFHMVLSYSRDPFCCFTTSQNLAVFWECHRRAFAHYGGVPGVIVYDRTKTVVRRHVAPGEAVPLHPEAVAFAGHYDFDIDVLAAYRPTGKGRIERHRRAPAAVGEVAGGVDRRDFCGVARRCGQAQPKGVGCGPCGRSGRAGSAVQCDQVPDSADRRLRVMGGCRSMCSSWRVHPARRGCCCCRPVTGSRRRSRAPTIRAGRCCDFSCPPASTRVPTGTGCGWPARSRCHRPLLPGRCCTCPPCASTRARCRSTSPTPTRCPRPSAVGTPSPSAWTGG
ncbi:IS21 family transposase [Streptomyces sp. NPDC054775]